MSRAISNRKVVPVHVHVRTYLGEQSALPLIEWLNSRPSSQRGLVEWITDRVVMLEQDNTVVERARDVLHMVQGAFRQHLAFRPVLELSFDEVARRKRWTFHWEPVAKAKVRQTEMKAILMIFELAAQGLVSRVRKCARPRCNQWFWARFERQRFHSRPCQEQDYHSTPAWRERRRTYMRELRQLHKKRGQRK